MPVHACVLYSRISPPIRGYPSTFYSDKETSPLSRALGHPARADGLGGGFHLGRCVAVIPAFLTPDVMFMHSGQPVLCPFTASLQLWWITARGGLACDVAWCAHFKPYRPGRTLTTWADKSSHLMCIVHVAPRQSLPILRCVPAAQPPRTIIIPHRFLLNFIVRFVVIVANVYIYTAILILHCP